MEWACDGKRGTLRRKKGDGHGEVQRGRKRGRSIREGDLAK